MAEHSDLTGADLHEPKGAASANAGEVYVGNGIGSGAWRGLEDVLTVDLENIDTATSWWVVAPNDGTIVGLYTVIHSVITSNNNISLELAGVPVTGGSVTLTAAGSAAGDVDTATITAANIVTQGQAIEIISDGLAGNACRCTVTLVIKRSS